MCNTPLMEVSHSLHDLSEDIASFCFGEPPPRLCLYILVKSKARHVLGDDVDLPGGLDDLVDSKDALVSERREDLDFSKDALLALGLHQLVLIIHLDSHLLARLLAHC